MTTCFIQDDKNKIQEKVHLEKENPMAFPLNKRIQQMIYKIDTDYKRQI